MNDHEEPEFRFVLDIEGEEAPSGPLVITKEVKLRDMIEIEDINFNHDSAVLLPIVPSSTRSALEELACCYLHAMQNPSKLMLLAGHTDMSGDAKYNVWLSEKRAENVLYILLGERDKWVESVCSERGREGTPAYATQKPPGDGKSKVKDYRMILKWVAGKFGWPCDPDLTKKAVETFQKDYNNEKYVGNKSIREIVGGSSIVEEGIINRETWGAFWDIYMVELAELLGLYKVINSSQIPDTSRLKTYRDALKFIAEDRKIVNCGEIHHKTRLHKSLTDRRVEILFFDPKEKPKLDFYPYCHEGLIFDVEKRAKPSERKKAYKKRDECELFGNPGIYDTTRVTCDLDNMLIIEVLDYKGNHMSDIPVNIDEVGRGTVETGKTDTSGVLIRKVTEGNFRVYVDTQNRRELEGFRGVEEKVEIKK